MNENPTTARFRLPRIEMRGSNGLGAVLLLGLLSAFIFFPYVLRFETRDAPARRVDTRLPGASTLEGLEYWLYDSYFADSSEGRPRYSNRISIVAIDQNSMNVIPEWPWSRHYYAQAIKRLNKAGARVIAIDIDFSSPQISGPNNERSAGDKELVKAVAEAKNVVLPSTFESGTGLAGGGQADMVVGAIRNKTYILASPFDEDEAGNPGLEENTPDISLTYLPVDGDGGWRRYPLVAKITGFDIGSFAALTCAIFQDMEMGDEGSEYETSLRDLEWQTFQKTSSQVPSRATRFPGKESPQFQEFLLKYRTSNAFPTYSFSNVISPDKYSDERLKRLFKDKLVFIGATAPILKDLFRAPDGGQISGVELHAGAACQLLEGAYIEPPRRRTTLINLFGMALISSLWPQLVRGRVSRLSRRAQERWKARKHFKRWRFRVQDTIWFFLTGTMALLPALCFWGLCQNSFSHYNVWLVVTYPLLASVFSAALATVYLFTLETAERRKVMRQVGLYLDPDIMETILAHPEEDYPRPRRTTATVMFTDLQGFTSYSENHSADDVVTALNAYMSRLQPIIKKHHGVVDKYIGDAIMSYFGVPVPRADHALWGLQCAIEIQEESARFRADTGIPFYTRIGLHTGELIAGSIGSQSTTGSLVNYTVIGDTVNLASRLEAKNKDFDSWILCSRVTIEAAPEIALVEPVRDKIKGKSQEVEMFIVRGRMGQEPRDAVWGAEMPAITTKPVAPEIEPQIIEFTPTNLHP